MRLIQCGLCPYCDTKRKSCKEAKNEKEIMQTVRGRSPRAGKDGQGDPGTARKNHLRRMRPAAIWLGL